MPLHDHPSGLPLGSPVLIYRYTVTGSDKASIDTGADAAQAGSNDWTNGDLLEIFMYARTDEAAVPSQLNYTVNNDTSSIYDLVRNQGVNAAITSASSLARANWFANTSGASATGSMFGVATFVIPNYGGTVGFKSGTMTSSVDSSAGATAEMSSWAISYRSTTGISRFAVVTNTAAKKLVVGSQLLVYKRTAL